MPKDPIFDDDKKVEFPKCNEILQKWSKERLLKEYERLKENLKEFIYDAKDGKLETNDVREGYEQFIYDGDKFLKWYHEMILDIIKAIEYYENIKEHASAIAKVSKYYSECNQKYQNDLIEEGIDPLDPEASIRQIEQHLDTKAQELLRRKDNLDKVEEEIAITEEKLAAKKSEMEKALQHRYTLTDVQKRTLIDEKDKILDGIEQWGSVSGALRHDKSITSKCSTIQLYANQFPEFGEAIAVSKALFRDRLDGIMIERAIEGTENPVFGKGEHIGDYKIKDNKLLTELLKAKIPEQYNKKSTENVKNTQINNLNITSFANIDETKQGFTKDVGVVIDVDDTGKVQRIQQEKKMIEFYEKKQGAEIIQPEEEKGE